jgi:DNA-binding LacI/PurR family transcriptional regulator
VFHEHWHDLLNSIRSDDEKAVWSAAVALIRHGHTSGADALAGFMMALTLLSA